MKLLSLKSCLLAAVAAAGIAAQGEVKVVRVVPNGEAGENSDGASWETAYGDIKLAYESLGADGGEVWVKKGYYILTNEVIMTSNVSVYGGFAGDETSREALDPVGNITLISGDRGMDDVWASSVSGGDDNKLVWDYDSLTFARPELANIGDLRVVYPHHKRTNTEWNSNVQQENMDASDETGCAFKSVSASFGEAVFDGLTFTGFKTNCICAVSCSESSLVVRNCRFWGCINGCQRDSTATNVGPFGPVRVLDVPLVVEGCEFCGCTRGINATSQNSVTETHMTIVSNCTLTAGVTGMGYCGIQIDGAASFGIVNCDLTWNFAQRGPMTGGLVSVSGTGVIERCLFATNTQLMRAMSPLVSVCHPASGSSSVDMRSCRFIGNKTPFNSAGVCAGVRCDDKTDTFRVWSSYFKDNCLESAGVVNGGCHLLAYGSVRFFNCSFEDNEISIKNNPSKAAVFALFTGLPATYAKCWLINCSLKNSKTYAADGCAAATVCIFGSESGVLNTVSLSDSDDYTAGTPTYNVSSVIQGINETNGVEFAETRKQGNGVEQIYVKTASKYPARPVWKTDDDNVWYWYGDLAPKPQKPWYSINDTRDAMAAANPPAGITLQSPQLADANGSPRHNGGDGLSGDAYGPLRRQAGGLMIILR